jgi:hypothetical protein
MYLFPLTFPKGLCAEGAFALDCSLSNCNHVQQIVVDAFWNSNKYVFVLLHFCSLLAFPLKGAM